MIVDDPGTLMEKVHETYRGILADIPDFNRNDRFLVNILSAAMLAAAGGGPCFDCHYQKRGGE